MYYSLIASAVMLLASTVPSFQSMDGMPEPSNEIHPVDITAELIAKYTADTTVVGGCIVSCDVCVWHTENGETNLSFQSSSVHLTGECEEANAIAADKIYDLLSKAAISQSIAEGYLPCSGDCENSTVKVYQDGCVRRTGGGAASTFESCNTGLVAEQIYSLCCQGEEHTVAFRDSESINVSGGDISALPDDLQKEVQKALKQVRRERAGK